MGGAEDGDLSWWEGFVKSVGFEFELKKIRSDGW